MTKNNMDNKRLVYIFVVISLIATFLFPTLLTPVIFILPALYFVEKVKKEDKDSGKKLERIIIAVLILEIIYLFFLGYLFSMFFSNILSRTA
jgi:hypothetical protein